MQLKIIVGTRGSDLALVQTRQFCAALEEVLPVKTEVKVVVTSGDRKQSQAGNIQRDKRDWVQQIEEALCAKEIDCAVHCSKDVPVQIAEGTSLLPVLEREFALDALVLGADHRARASGRISEQLAFIPHGARIGTASLRRKGQLLRLRPDLEIVEWRGNVPSRLVRLDADSQMFGIILAQAGLKRLGLGERIDLEFSPQILVPAVNQGILAVQFRPEDSELSRVLRGMAAPGLFAVWEAERACIRGLGADCRSAVGVFGVIELDELVLLARVVSRDGRECVEASLRGEPKSAEALGNRLAQELLEKGALNLLF